MRKRGASGRRSRRRPVELARAMDGRPTDGLRLGVCRVSWRAFWGGVNVSGIQRVEASSTCSWSGRVTGGGERHT